MKNLIQMTNEGVSQVENLFENIQIEDLICQVSWITLSDRCRWRICFALQMQKLSKDRYKWRTFLLIQDMGGDD